MGLDDGADNRGSETGPFLFSMGDKGLEKPFPDGFGDAAGVVLKKDFHQAFGSGMRSGDLDFPRLFPEGFNGVAEHILEDAKELLLGAQYVRFRQVEGNADVPFGKVEVVEGAKLVKEFLDVDFGLNEIVFASGKLRELGDHGDHPVDLFLNVLAEAKRFRIVVPLAQELGTEADEAKGVFEIVDDGVGHAPDEGQFLLMHAVADKLGCRSLEMGDDGLQQSLDGPRHFTEVIDEDRAGNTGNGAICFRGCPQGAAVVGKDANFPEKVARLALADTHVSAVLNFFPKADDAVEDEEDGVRKVMFVENDRSFRQALNNRGPNKGFHMLFIYLPEERMCFEIHAA